MVFMNVHPGSNRPPRVRRPAAVLAIAALMASALAAAPLAARNTSIDRLITQFEVLDPHLHVVEATSSALRFDLRRAEARTARAGRTTARTRSLQVSAPSEVGQWAPPVPMMVSGIHGVQLPTGRVLFIANIANFTELGHAADAWTWDPATGDWNHVPPPTNPVTGKPFNVWCGGQSFLSDGRLVIAGGNARFPDATIPAASGNDYKGLDRIFTFNPFDETWTAQPKMRHGRWYPTLVTLPDDRVVILGGLDETGFGTRNIDLEVFTPSPSINGVGAVAHKPSGDRDTQLYPHLKYFPGNRVVLTGPDAGDAGILNTSTWTWSALPEVPVDRLWSAAVIDPYDAASGPTSITVVGGSDGGSADSDGRTFRLNLAGGSPSWSAGPTMARGRSHVNVELLPDGAKVAIGGGLGLRAPDRLYAGPVFTAEITGSSGAWLETPAQTIRRTYHSSSVLLPDARVVSSGDDKGTLIRDMEIYSPPYLFRGARPTITDAPTAVTYGEQFRVTTPNGPAVTRVVLMAPSAVTHSTDMNQRHIRLNVVSDGAGSLLLDAPTSPESVLPGYYMLYLLDADGVPSVAKWLRITGNETPGSGPPRPPDPPVAPTPTPTPDPAPTVAVTPPPTTITPVQIPTPPRAFLSAKLTRPVRGQLWSTARFGTAGVLRVTVETRRGVRQLCRIAVKANAPVRCRLDGRLRGSDRVILTFTATNPKTTTARILRVR
jgi:Domain of unknown function (DUF1929)